MATFISDTGIVNAPVNEVWKVVADYGNVLKWHPYMVDSYLTDDSQNEGIGAARIGEFGPNMAIKETVTQWRDNEFMEITIDFVRGFAPPIENLFASIATEPVDETRTRVSFHLKYDTRLGMLGTIADKIIVKRMYQSVFANMLKGLQLYVEKGEEPPLIPMMGSGAKVAS